jgi:predicted GNAT superfamily acetyltransferase
VSDAITIRALESQADLDACVALQRDTWGRAFADVVPASILLVAQNVGGVAAGAFDSTGHLVGFVFGMTGVENGELVHWSDMLAVRPSVQNRGIGRRLKQFQREAVARLGVKVIYWTFDPLVARNAHMNFNVFGARAVRYVRDMYGRLTGSDLHRGIGTDRLIVAWPVDEGRQEEQRRFALATREAVESATAPVLADLERPGLPTDEIVGRKARIRIAVPADIEPMIVRDEGRAVSWREASRRAFEASWDAGYRVDGFRLDPGNGRGFYLLSRSSAT